MPTIHITCHIDDSLDALGVVAAALNGGYEVRIDLDEIMDDIDQAAQAAATNAQALLAQVEADHDATYINDKLKGYAYALESGDQIAGRVVGSVHYAGGVDGTGTYTILFTNGDEWRGKGRQIVAPFGVEQRMKAKRAAEKGREIAKQYHPVVDEVDQALRQEAYDARLAETEGAQGFKCPKCHAPKGKPCITPEGKPYRSFAHIDRVRKFMPKWVP